MIHPSRERRRASRLTVRLPARYRSEAISLDGMVADLSRSGLFLRSGFVDAEGTPAALRIDLPGAPLDLLCEVARCWAPPSHGEAGMGLRFLSLPSPTRQRLANFILSHSMAH
ncbi:MAG TPA: PilZ domain-containing protein [Kofleriaceae bacterium]|nr:PilZ domain-containing protein [Kofleriaceae bacterium]